MHSTCFFFLAFPSLPSVSLTLPYLHLLPFHLCVFAPLSNSPSSFLPSLSVIFSFFLFISLPLSPPLIFWISCLSSLFAFEFLSLSLSFLALSDLSSCSAFALHIRSLLCFIYFLLSPSIFLVDPYEAFRISKHS